MIYLSGSETTSADMCYNQYFEVNGPSHLHHSKTVNGIGWCDNCAVK